MNNPTVFFHKDLDGIVSYLVFCWAVNKKLNYVATTPMKLEQDYDNWASKNDTSAVFVDLDVTKIGSKIDKPTTIIFDHHKTNLYSFQQAKAKIQNESSCAKLLYDYFFKNDTNKITSAQKTLIALADDWDSHTKAVPLSEDLNIVYHSLTNKVESFIDDYYRGFTSFDKFKQNTILLYKKHRKEYLSSLSPFFGHIEIEGIKTHIGAVVCNQYVQECCDFLLGKHNVDVAIAVIVEQKRIAVRRNSKNNTVDVSKFVQRIANGGGHEAAAGGNLTEEFVEFTKLLNQ